MPLNPRHSGTIAVILSVFCFYLSSIPIRWEREIGTLGGPEFAFARFLLGSILVCGYLLWKQTFPRPDKPLILFSRVLFHFLAVWLYYLCIEMSNAALGNVLHMTYPLFAALILAVAGKSRSPGTDLLFTAISVAGIALTTNMAGSNSAIIVGVLSGFSGAFSIILLSSTRQGNSTADVFFFTFLGGLFLSAILTHPHLVINSGTEAWYLFLSALVGVAGQIVFTYGAAFIPAVESSVLSCLRIPLALVGATIGLESTEVTGRAWIGAILVFAANIAVIKRRSLSAENL